MSRTLRNRHLSDSELPDWVILNHDEKELKELILKVRTVWAAYLYRSIPKHPYSIHRYEKQVRRYNKQELIQFKKNPEYEVQCLAKPPLPSWVY